MPFKPKWKNPSGTKEYFAWRSMRSRCLRPWSQQFNNYGGRGISVCDRWANNYDAFFEDMGKAPAGYTLERLDVNSGYSPENCRWAGWPEQVLNKRTNVRVEMYGESMTISEWERKLGLRKGTLYKRLSRLPAEEALTAELLGKKWRHGTRNGYETGCRCTECRSAHAQRHREARARRKHRAACGSEVSL